MQEQVIFADFGGQGVMLIGQLVTYAGMMEGANVSWMPSYGPEMRGGTANCQVVVSPKEVSSPLVTEPTSLIALNKPSLDKFAPWVRRGGLIIYNSSLIELPPERTDVRVLAVPANKIANELGDLRIANMVALGAYLATTRVVGSDTVLDAMKKVLPERRHNLIPLNRQALARGIEIASIWHSRDQGEVSGAE
ncbi:MAG: 2-oxoacid:ferredoxin oxidoreductase subunit gamma [Firmicutes bacterium]|nr:2-oxoacid:ferredoxin oxidoreductase subunit gamma [Bacillota bacterium]